jgi:YVTN family beta-propeller protein
VTNCGSPTMTRIDSESNEVIDTIGLHFGPEGLAFTDDGLWVANQTAGSVSFVDPVTNEETAEIEIGRLPEGIALADDGRVWVATTNMDHIEAVDPDAGEVVATIETGSEPRRIVIVDGTAWVTNSADGTVSAIPLD